MQNKQIANAQEQNRSGVKRKQVGKGYSCKCGYKLYLYLSPTTAPRHCNTDMEQKGNK